ncbi:MAG: 50S ribosomal protein L4 [Acidobacteria bacterium]|nr:50S ribosomal protein L4 [Acidobacteriota bacterium]
MKAPLYTSDGTSLGDVKLDAAIFGIEPNMDVLHQVITAQLAAKRSGSASTKTRSEVRGGGRKPWRQKGLGRARQGSIRAPHWVGGGVAHGPKPRDYTQRTPKKMKRLALRSALSARASESAVKVVEDFDWAAPKTKQAVSLLDAVGASTKAVGASTKTLVVLSSIDGVAGRSFRNLPEVILAEPGQLTPYDVLWADQVIFTSHTVGSVGQSSTYEVSERDFVKDDASDSVGGKDASDSVGGKDASDSVGVRASDLVTEDGGES